MIATLVLLAQLATPLAAAEPQVIRQGFCVTRSEHGCSEVVLPGTAVDLKRLPRRADGTRVLPFFAVLSAEARGTDVHVLEAEDAEAETVIVAPNGGPGPTAAQRSTLAALPGKLNIAGAVTLTPFRAEGRSDSWQFSEIVVEGPGNFHGQVVDAAAKPLAGSTRVTVNVYRGAP